MWTSSNVGFSHEIGWSNLPPVWQNPCTWSLQAQVFQIWSSTFLDRTLAFKAYNTLTQQAKCAITHLLYVLLRFFPPSLWLKLSLLWWCWEGGCSCWITTLVPSTTRGRFDPMSPTNAKGLSMQASPERCPGRQDMYSPSDAMISTTLFLTQLLTVPSPFLQEIARNAPSQSTSLSNKSFKKAKICTVLQWNGSFFTVQKCW